MKELFFLITTAKYLQSLKINNNIYLYKYIKNSEVFGMIRIESIGIKGVELFLMSSINYFSKISFNT